MSVIVPAFNATATLERTLASALAQSWRDLEVVVVDDGSTDATDEIARRFAAADRRVRVVGKPNGGLATAWNCGLTETRGPWIAPLDADDLWHPEKIEKQLAAALAASPAPGFVYCFSRRIDDEDRVIGAVPSFACTGRAFNRHVWRNFVGNGSACLYQRRAVEAAGGYDEAPHRDGAEGAEDLLLQLSIARNRTICCVPEYLVGYRYGGRLSFDPHGTAAAWRGVAATLSADACPPAHEALRWASAGRTFNYAEGMAWRGAWLTAARLLLEAAASDPEGTAKLLRWRIARMLRRRLARDPAAETLSLFFALDPKAAPAQEFGARGAAWKALQRLQQKRLARLESLDAAL